MADLWKAVTMTHAREPEFVERALVTGRWNAPDVQLMLRDSGVLDALTEAEATIFELQTKITDARGRYEIEIARAENEDWEGAAEERDKLRDVVKTARAFLEANEAAASAALRLGDDEVTRAAGLEPSTPGENIRLALISRERREEFHDALAALDRQEQP